MGIVEMQESVVPWNGYRGRGEGRGRGRGGRGRGRGQLVDHQSQRSTMQSGVISTDNEGMYNYSI